MAPSVDMCLYELVLERGRRVLSKSCIVMCLAPSSLVLEDRRMISRVLKCFFAIAIVEILLTPSIAHYDGCSPLVLGTNR